VADDANARRHDVQLLADLHTDFGQHRAIMSAKALSFGQLVTNDRARQIRRQRFTTFFPGVCRDADGGFADGRRTLGTQRLGLVEEQIRLLDGGLLAAGRVQPPQVGGKLLLEQIAFDARTLEFLGE
jgi:hypothetical protein